MALSRRDFLKLGAAAVGTAALAGCNTTSPMGPANNGSIIPVSLNFDNQVSLTEFAGDQATLNRIYTRYTAAPRNVPYLGTEPAGTIIINQNAHLLHIILPNGQAREYVIAVGREGVQRPSGTMRVFEKQMWPTYDATRGPGAPNNPLGSRALVLRDANGNDFGFRVHGTTAPQDLGKDVSLGCIRMHEYDIRELFNMVNLNTRVMFTNDAPALYVNRTVAAAPGTPAPR